MSRVFVAVSMAVVAAQAGLARPAERAQEEETRSRVSRCRPTEVRRVRGDARLVLGNARLGRIEKGRVACLHVEDASPAHCAFTSESGGMVETAEGDFAVAGQSIGLDGRRGGDYVVAARMDADDTVPCVEPTSRDSVGTAAGMELAGGCTLETLNSASNANAQLLANFATREVCTSSSVHPDGAAFTRMNGTSYCYTGTGAALNDSSGQERDETGAYLPGWEHCHELYTGYYLIPAAKRPATGGGWPITLNIHSPIVWRPVSQSLSIAN